MKNKLTLFTGIMIFTAVVCSGTILDVDQCYQEETQWCWAGCSQTIFRHYETNITQTTIAAYGTEGRNDWNYLYGSSSSPVRRGINLILNHFASLSSSYGYYTLSQTEILNILDDRRLFIVRWGWDTSGGHFVVGHGLDGNTMHLMDPWYGPTINSYDWVLRGSSHTWTHTLEVTTAAPPITHPAPIVITDFVKAASPTEFQLTWSSLPNRDYSLWRCSSLSSSNWTCIVTNIAASTTNCTSTVNTTANDCSFYSIRWDQP